MFGFNVLDYHSKDLNSNILGNRTRVDFFCKTSITIFQHYFLKAGFFKHVYFHLYTQQVSEVLNQPTIWIKLTFQSFHCK